ncbi:MAG: glycosyltransferase family 2 protein [Chloroflexota bacterium]
MTPTYSHERFIAQCIESVLAQTYRNWEMIVVDDGSTDGTWDIVLGYGARDPRIRPFRQQNRGIWKLAETYNFALRESRGELLAILEGDDAWPHEKLAVQVPLHRSTACAISFGQASFVDPEGRAILGSCQPGASLAESRPRDLFVSLVRGEFFIPPVTVILSRADLLAAGGFKQPSYLPVTDYPTWVSMGAGGAMMAFIPQVLGYWRQSAGQATWLLARDIARGIFRFTLELVDSAQLDLGGVARDRLPDYLLSDNRRRFFATSSYRAATIAVEAGAFSEAFDYCWEVARLHEYRLLAQCLAMFGWKAARKLGRRARRQPAMPRRETT